MARRPNPPTEPPHDADTGEILDTGRSRSLAPRQATVFTFGQVSMDNFVITKHVSVPMLEVPAGMSFIAQMADIVRVLPKIEGVRSKMKGDHYASTILAPNGEARLLTWSTVFKSEMEKFYPDDSYVGKWFRITKIDPKPGKDYWTFAIQELALRGQTIEAEAAD